MNDNLVIYISAVLPYWVIRTVGFCKRKNKKTSYDKVSLVQP